jgi:hypothetical protein
MVLVTLLVLGLAGFASAQMTITGYLTTEMEPVQVDSTYLEYGSVQNWFPTPGWNANPNETATYTFPDFPGWPAIIQVAATVAGMPVIQRYYRPEQDTWYAFEPPFEQIKVKFHGELGIEEETTIGFPLPVSGILTNQDLYRVVNNNPVEIISAAGQICRSLPLAPGVYFCRFANSPSELKRFTIVR